MMKGIRGERRGGDKLRAKGNRTTIVGQKFEEEQFLTLERGGEGRTLKRSKWDLDPEGYLHR